MKKTATAVVVVAIVVVLLKVSAPRCRRRYFNKFKP